MQPSWLLSINGRLAAQPPRFSHAAGQHPAGFRVADDLFPIRIPTYLAFQPGTDINQMGDRITSDGVVYVGNGLSPGLYTVEKVALVARTFDQMDFIRADRRAQQ